VPYPPGIPILAPGERTGSQDSPLLQYLTALQDFDNAFPGFEHDTHGIECENGVYRMYCIKEDVKKTKTAATKPKKSTEMKKGAKR
jgi:arginine decarboxylase